jgi:hypothetical protein
MKRVLFIALALAAGAVAAQAQKPPAQEERPSVSTSVSNTEPAPRLNLRLDDAARYSREVPREGAGSAPLPTLGGDARPLPAQRMSTTDRPFPPDSERGER